VDQEETLAPWHFPLRLRPAAVLPTQEIHRQSVPSNDKNLLFFPYGLLFRMPRLLFLTKLMHNLLHFLSSSSVFDPFATPFSQHLHFGRFRGASQTQNPLSCRLSFSFCVWFFPRLEDLNLKDVFGRFPRGPLRLFFVVSPTFSPLPQDLFLFLRRIGLF